MKVFPVVDHSASTARFINYDFSNDLFGKLFFFLERRKGTSGNQIIFVWEEKLLLIEFTVLVFFYKYEVVAGFTLIVLAKKPTAEDGHFGVYC